MQKVTLTEGIGERKKNDPSDLLSNLLSNSPSVAVYRVNREQMIYRATGALTSKFVRGTQYRFFSLSDLRVS